jgi:hypothetical protein
MAVINIIIPASDYDRVAAYYRKLFMVTDDDDLLYLPVDGKDVALKVVRVSLEAQDGYPPQKRFPIFEYELERNFLSHCLRMHRCGAIFEKAFEYPGGFYARVRDPEGNQFGIVCESFEEEYETIDVNDLPFFFRY